MISGSMHWLKSYKVVIYHTEHVNRIWAWKVKKHINLQSESEVTLRRTNERKYMLLDAVKIFQQVP